MPGRPIVTFDLDGVLCRPPLGINPGRNLNKRRKSEGGRSLLSATERWRYVGRQPMPGARDAFLWYAEQFDCQVLTARTEDARHVTEAWFRRWFGVVPLINMRPTWRETSAGFKVRRARELGAIAHFEDDAHTAEWMTEVVQVVFVVDWWRNRWLKAPGIKHIRWLAEAGATLRELVAPEPIAEG